MQLARDLTVLPVVPETNKEREAREAREKEGESMGVQTATTTKQLQNRVANVLDAFIKRFPDPNNPNGGVGESKDKGGDRTDLTQRQQTPAERQRDRTVLRTLIRYYVITNVDTFTWLIKWVIKRGLEVLHTLTSDFS